MRCKKIILIILITAMNIAWTHPFDYRDQMDFATQQPPHNHDSLLSIQLQKIENYKKTNDALGIATANRSIGDSYLIAGDQNLALTYYWKALEYTTSKDSLTNAPIYSGLALSYKLLGDYAKALEYAQKSLVLSPESKQGKLHYDIATIFMDMQDAKKAIYYFGRAETLSKKYGNPMQQADIYTGKASAYAMAKDSANAMRCFEQALAITQKHNLQASQKFIYATMGAFEVERNNPDEVIKYLLLAKSIPVNSPPSFNNKIDINLSWGYLQKQEYDRAIHLLQNAIPVATHLRSPIALMVAQEHMAYAYKGKGKYDLAFDYLTKSKAVSDSINENKKIEAAKRIEARFRNEQKDMQLVENELIIKKKDAELYLKNTGIALGVFVVVLLILFILVLHRNYLGKQALKDEKLQNVYQTQELDKIKAMIQGEESERSRIANELHDGIMAHLSASKMHLKALVANKERTSVPTESLYKIIEELDIVSEDLRRSAHNLLPDMLLEEGLAGAVYYFCNSIKKGEGLKINYSLMSEVPRFKPKFELAIYRTIQEFFQNIIKHAQAKEVYIQLSFDNNLLNIVIEDDGIGMDTSRVESSNGQGLKNIRRKLAFLNGKMEIDSSAEGTSINLEFDLN